jgi:dipeptidyl aminopeptidase/acylaminoacyl peptidase
VYAELDLANRADILVLPLDAQGRAGDPRPILTERYSEGNGTVSRDGSWIAYESDETGETEVYIRAFPEGARRWQVSRSGGARPRWSKDGSRLRFLGAEGLLEVDLEKGPGAMGDARLVQARENWLDILVIESDSGELLVGKRMVEELRRESVHVVLGIFAELGSPR